MVGLASLWLPIVLSAVAVFVVSSIIHMATPWHKGDYPKLPNEAAVADALRPLAIPPGEYMLPRAQSTAEMKSPEFQDKLNRGPVAILTMVPAGPITMGKSLFQWFVYSLVVSIFAGYVAGRALLPGADYLSVFRLAGTTAFAGYALALWQMTIWYKRSPGVTLRSTVDGLIYALVTAGFFGAFWPGS